MLDSSEESGTETESDKNEREDREEDEIQEIGRVEGRRKKKLPKGRKAQRGIADFELPVRVQLHKDVKDHKEGRWCLCWRKILAYLRKE